MGFGHDDILPNVVALLPDYIHTSLKCFQGCPESLLSKRGDFPGAGLGAGVGAVLGAVEGADLYAFAGEGQD
jgi:hypothetical protein